MRKNTYTGIRYCDDRTIFLWELANEPMYPKHQGDPEQIKYWNRWLKKKYGTEEEINKKWIGSFTLKPDERIGNIPIPSDKEIPREADFREFAAQIHNDWGWELSTLIQELDSNHLVNRNIGAWWWDKDDSYADLDKKQVIDEHSYGVSFQDLIQHYYDCAKKAHMKYRQPFILGEFGQPISYPARYQLFEVYKEIFLKFRLSGIQFWNWGLAQGIVNCDQEPYSDVWEIFPWEKDDRWETLKLIDLIKDTSKGCELLGKLETIETYFLIAKKSNLITTTEDEQFKTQSNQGWKFFFQNNFDAGLKLSSVLLEMLKNKLAKKFE